MEVYECISCKQMTEGFPATLRRKCLICRNLELEMWYHKKKFEIFSKKELIDCHKDLLAKLRVDEDYKNRLSEKDDDSHDEDFIPSTPGHKDRKRKSMTRNEHKKSKRAKEQESEKESPRKNWCKNEAKSHLKTMWGMNQCKNQTKSHLKMMWGMFQKNMEKNFHLGSILRATN